MAIVLASSVGLLAGCASVLIPSNSPANASAVISPPGAVELDYSYHSQQNGDWCDPADIEMWLQADHIALPSGNDHTIQQTFWSYETSHNDGYTVAEWNASPYAVAVTIAHYGHLSGIGDAPQPTLAAAGAVISESVANLHQPVIVMIYGASHYVLITGVQLGPGGAEAAPLEVTFANPLAFGVSATPPGGSDGAETMSWSDFAASYTADTHHGGIWANQWVLIASGIPLLH